VTKGRPPRTRFRRVATSERYYWPTVWTDAQHLTAVGLAANSNGDGEAVLNSVDVRTGTALTLVSGVTSSGGTSTAQVFATGLMTASTAHAEAPHARNPHQQVAGLLGLGLALVAGVALWRRRRA
jgi:MYXO-CTERM domain-containing protein